MEEVLIGFVGFEKVKVEYVDLVFFDVGLLDIDGCEVCCLMRKVGVNCFVIMFIGYDFEVDMILGLDVGVNDYVIKLFWFGVLLVCICVYLCSYE